MAEGLAVAEGDGDTGTGGADVTDSAGDGATETDGAAAADGDPDAETGGVSSA